MKEYVKCLLCGEERIIITSSHLKLWHNTTIEEYRKKFPSAELCSDKLRQHRSEASLGNKYALGHSYTVSEETKQRISAAMIGSKTSLGNKNALGHTFVMDKEARQRISKALTERPVSEETKQKISQALMNHPVSEESKQKMTASQLARPLPSEETKQRQSEALRRTWQDPYFIARWTEGMSEALRRRPNESELQLQSILDEHFPGEWAYTGDGSTWIGRKNPDFLNNNGRKQVIEMFGVFWHSEDEVEPLVAYYKSFGFDCLIIWECDVYSEAEVLKRVKEYRNELIRT